MEIIVNMRRGHYNYKDFDKEIKSEKVDEELFKLVYYNIHGNLVKEVVKDKDKRIKEIEKERKEFELLVDGNVIYPLSKQK